MKNLRVSSIDLIHVKKNDIHKFVSKILRETNTKISSLDINFLSDDEIVLINNEYLKHNFTTDIITFNYSGETDNFDGELFICLDEAKRNSKKYKNTIENELERLIIHGILHLMGYDDTTDILKKKMKKYENSLVKILGNSLTKGTVLYDN